MSKNALPATRFPFNSVQPYLSILFLWWIPECLPLGLKQLPERHESCPIFPTRLRCTNRSLEKRHYVRNAFGSVSVHHRHLFRTFKIQCWGLGRLRHQRNMYVSRNRILEIKCNFFAPRERPNVGLKRRITLLRNLYPPPPHESSYPKLT